MCPPATSRTGSVAKKASGKSRRESPAERARKGAGLIEPNIHVVTREPLRIQILSIAVSRAIAASEFAEELEIPLGTASYHFRVLRENGFLEIVREERVRGSTVKKFHRATRSGFISDADWGEVHDALRPGVAGAILQDFNGRVADAIATRSLFTRDDACLFWKARCLDEQGWAELVKVIGWAIQESEQLELEAVERRANGESSEDDCMSVTFAIAGFPSPTPEEVKAAERKPKTSSGRKSLKKSKGK